MEWISVKDRLPEKDQWVLCLRTGDNWIVDGKPFKYVIVSFVTGLSLTDRAMLPCEDVRKRTYSRGDEHENNKVPYCWESFGPGYEFGQCVSHWQPLPELPKEHNVRN